MQFVFMAGNLEDTIVLQKQLADEQSALAFHGFTVVPEIYRQDKTTYLKIKTNNPYLAEGQQLLLRYLLSGMMADFILKHWSKKILWNLARKQYAFLGEEKWQEIVHAFCSNSPGQEELTLLAEDWKTRVWQSLWDYFGTYENHFLNIDGFIRFRLISYVKELKQALAKKVDYFLLEQEYEEFLTLLHTFVQQQDKVCNKIHLIWESPKRFLLLDAKGEQLPLEKWAEDFPVSELNPEEEIGDLLISALIQLAPAALVIHTCETKQSNILKTICEIWRDELEICTSCSFCQSYFDKLRRKEYNN